MFGLLVRRLNRRLTWREEMALNIVKHLIDEAADNCHAALYDLDLEMKDVRRQIETLQMEQFVENWHEAQ